MFYYWIFLFFLIVALLWRTEDAFRQASKDIILSFLFFLSLPLPLSLLRTALSLFSPSFYVSNSLQGVFGVGFLFFRTGLDGWDFME